MRKVRFAYYKEEDFYAGYLDEYHDYMTQGKTLEELKENLEDLYIELSSGEIPNVRHKSELIIK